jgi:hypothetical protein
MLDRLAASTHRIRIFVQARLHGIDNVLVLPPPDAFDILTNDERFTDG